MSAYRALPGLCLLSLLAAAPAFGQIDANSLTFNRGDDSDLFRNTPLIDIETGRFGGDADANLGAVAATVDAATDSFDGFYALIKSVGHLTVSGEEFAGGQTESDAPSESRDNSPAESEPINLYGSIDSLSVSQAGEAPTDGAFIADQFADSAASAIYSSYKGHLLDRSQASYVGLVLLVLLGLIVAGFLLSRALRSSD
jgi:hypothetical protein